MNPISFEAWGWASREGSVQLETFKTADEAIKGMIARGAGDSLQEIEKVGYRLVRLKLTLEVIAKMEPIR